MNVITNNSKDDNTVFIYYLNANLGKFIFLIKDKKITASYFERSIFGPNKEGWIYKACVKRYVDFLNSCFVDLGNKDIGFFSSKNTKYETGDYVLLRVKRNPISSKKILLSNELSLREKYLILNSAPGSTKIRFSKKIIRNIDLIKKLRKLLPINGYQLIIRSAAEHATIPQILHNCRLLQILLIRIKQLYEIKKNPGVIYQKKDYSSEFLSQNKINYVYTNNLRLMKKEFQNLLSSKNKLNKPIKFYHSNLNNFNLIDTIINSFKKIITLPNGISLNIDKTEMGWMIDINSGSKINYEGDKSSLDMIYEVNLNATNAIIEQLHLKNMYGIIIIDYINMNKEYLRIKLTDYLRTLSLNDRGLIRIHNMTEESLVTLIKESKNVVQNYNEEERLFWLLYFELQKKILKSKKSLLLINLTIKNFKLLNFILHYNLTKFFDPTINVNFVMDESNADYEINSV